MLVEVGLKIINAEKKDCTKKKNWTRFFFMEDAYEDPRAVAAMYVAAFQLMQLRKRANKERRRCGQCIDCTARCRSCIACFRRSRKQGCRQRPACRYASDVSVGGALGTIDG